MRVLMLPALALALSAGPGLSHAAEPAADPVVAIVNGTEIHRAELEAAQSRLPEQYRQAPLQSIYEPLLEQVISGQLLAAEAERRKLDALPEVQQDIARAREDVLRNSLVEQAIEQGSTEEKLKAAYEAQKSQPGFAAEEVHAAHILVASEAEAREVIGKIDQGGDFAELAKAQSTDPSAKSNAGDLGYFRREAMVPEFSQAAFTIPPGTIGKEPVRSQFGWHVIKVVDRRTAVPTFEEKEPELREQVAREIVNGLVTQAHQGATIQRFNIDGTPKAP
jgi:peptidyl-prolyl cis-trans isomerase C